MSNKKKILFSFGIPAFVGIVFLISFVNTCERIPELILQITTDSIETLTGREYKLTGSIVSFGQEKVTQHGFCWSETSNPTTTGTATQLGSRNSKGSFTSTISDLTYNTNYYVRAFVTTNAVTEYGNEKTLTTPAFSLPTLTTNKVIKIIADAAQCGGNITDDGGTEVTARGVCWSIFENPTLSDSLTTDGTGAGTFTSTISGLENNTQYYVRAYATNVVGTAYGLQEEFTSAPSIVFLPTVTTSSISNITASSAESGGNVTSDVGGTLSARGVCWSTSSNPNISNNHTEDSIGTGTFISSISGLTPNTTYYVKAYATNDQGIAYGEEKTFTTQINRRSVLEYFTNAAGDTMYNADAIVKQFATDNAEKVYDLHYHMDYPKEDPINLDNPQPPSTRAFNYSVPMIPFAVLNGGVTSEYRFDLNPPIAELDEDLLLTASLELPLFELSLTIDYKENSLEGNVTVICLDESFDSQLQLYIVVIEKEVTKYPGLNQGIPFRNVVLDMIPSPVGKLLGDNWKSVSTVEEGFQWYYPGYVEDAEDLCVVTFIQNRANGWILQADAVPFQ